MYPILILREELVCLIILIFMAATAGNYAMGKDQHAFWHLLTFAVLHVVFDIITVWTVNHTETTPPWLNKTCHVIFYLAAILFAFEISRYVLELCYPGRKRIFYAWGLILPAVYLLVVPFLPIEYTQVTGTRASTGLAPYVGYGLAYIYLFSSLALIFANYKKIPKPIKQALLPMLMLMIAAESAQIVIRELLFTGGALTVITVGFFFSLENPVLVFEQKKMTDALTGVLSRHQYETDVQRLEKTFAKEPNQELIFVYCDINNLRQVNRNYGHAEGDHYIRLIASALSDCLVSAASVYRMGGDEFLVSYSHVPEETVQAELLALREYCDHLPATEGYQPGVAIGYAVASPEYKSIQEVIRTADYMMFQNKEARKKSVELGEKVVGTKLNLTGLTDRMFSVMCASNERTYPFVTNMSTGVTRISPAWNAYFGMEGEFFANFTEVWAAKIHPLDRKKFLDDIVATASGNQKYHNVDYRAMNRQGTYVTCSCRGAVFHGEDETDDIFAGFMVNHGVEEKVDSVTGLPNFHALDDMNDDLIRTNGHAFILKLGLLNFNHISMLYGFNAAGTMLSRIGALLREKVGNRGEVYCQDAVNFSMLLTDPVEKSDVEELYHWCQEMLRGQVSINGITIPLAAAGAAFELQPNFQEDTATMRRCLMFALEESIEKQNHRLVFYSGNMANAASGNLDLLSAIYKDASSDQKYFQLRYQPIVGVLSGDTLGAEALLRWIHPQYGEIQPGQFISTLESDPCYYDLGLKIIRDSVQYASNMQKIRPNFRINVNITAIQLQNEDFIASVESILREANLDPQYLVLELTERCKEMELSFLKPRVAALREHGIMVAFDDMGTGYATMDLLMNIPVDEVKLDRSFVTALPTEPNYRIFMEALVRLSGTQKMVFCFEGIENLEILRFVQQYPGNVCQGYYFNKPLLPEEFEPRLKENAERNNKEKT